METADSDGTIRNFPPAEVYRSLYLAAEEGVSIIWWLGAPGTTRATRNQELGRRAGGGRDTPFICQIIIGGSGSRPPLHTVFSSTRKSNRQKATFRCSYQNFL